MLLKLPKKYYIVLDNTRGFSIDTENDIGIENDFENNNILRIFINILDDFLDLISSE